MRECWCFGPPVADCPTHGKTPVQVERVIKTTPWVIGDTPLPKPPVRARRVGDAWIAEPAAGGKP